MDFGDWKGIFRTNFNIHWILILHVSIFAMAVCIFAVCAVLCDPLHSLIIPVLKSVIITASWISPIPTNGISMQMILVGVFTSSTSVHVFRLFMYIIKYSVTMTFHPVDYICFLTKAFWSGQCTMICTTVTKKMIAQYTKRHIKKNFSLVSPITITRSYYDNILNWMPWNLTDDKSTLVLSVVWCRHAANHCLSRRWSRSLLPYGVIKPQYIHTYVYM